MRYPGLGDKPREGPGWDRGVAGTAKRHGLRGRERGGPWGERSERASEGEARVQQLKAEEKEMPNATRRIYYNTSVLRKRWSMPEPEPEPEPEPPQIPSLVEIEQLLEETELPEKRLGPKEL